MDADPAREHLRALSAAGIGWKRAAELAGLSSSAVSKLLYGGPGDRPPSRRIRPETAAAILGIRPSADLAAPGTLVDSAGTRRRAQALVAIGWPRARIAAEAGMSPSNFGQTLQREQVCAGTARAVREIYDRLWDTPPDEGDRHARAGVARARNYAAARGWVPPLGWDDDVIDDPDGRPADGWKRPARATRRRAELAEDAEELIRREGYTREHAAARLGVSLGALEAALSRTRHAGSASTRRSAPASPPRRRPAATRRRAER